MADSPLLTLPAELRNLIYEYVTCSDSTVTMKVNPGGHIIQPHVALTNHEVRSEFLPLFSALILERADAVSAVIVNHNFGPLIDILQSPTIRARAE
ncbi:hypothetical protein LTR85_001439 [Meristemomyces frigidus]|nr:hypothetical protein LTR85_001439 [Meristemomyces frigidus]